MDSRAARPIITRRRPVSLQPGAPRLPGVCRRHSYEIGRRREGQQPAAIGCSNNGVQPPHLAGEIRGRCSSQLRNDKRVKTGSPVFRRRQFITASGLWGDDRLLFFKISSSNPAANPSWRRAGSLTFRSRALRVRFQEANNAPRNGRPKSEGKRSRLRPSLHPDTKGERTSRP